MTLITRILQENKNKTVIHFIIMVIIQCSESQEKKVDQVTQEFPHHPDLNTSLTVQGIIFTRELKQETLVHLQSYPSLLNH